RIGPGWLIVGLTLSLALAAQENDSLAKRLDRLARWLKSPRESIRLEAVTELNDISIESARPLLLRAVQDTSTVVRAAAATSLARSHDPQVVPFLRPLLKDSDEHIRAEGVWALANCGGKGVLPDVIPLCREDASGLVRFRAVWGLALIGDK